MAKTILEFKCLLMSPGDVPEERKAASEVVIKWNALIGKALNTKIDLVKWETHSAPELNNQHPQKTLNDQIVDDADFGIGIFWSKLGTPTDTHASGTVEEIETLLNKGVKVSIYISNRAVPADMETEKEALDKYIETLKPVGLLQYYTDTTDFRELLLLHLTKWIVDLIYKEKQPNQDDTSLNNKITQPKEITSEASQPDIRIRTEAAVAPIKGEIKWFLSVKIENHSSHSIFLNSIMILLADGRRMFVERDAITNAQNGRKRLNPGEALHFHYDPAIIFSENNDLQNYICINVKDDIDRIYESEKQELQKTLVSLKNITKT